MDVQTLYRQKLTSADQAAALIASNSDVAMGMAAAEPPALLAALARRTSTARPCANAPKR